MSGASGGRTLQPGDVVDANGLVFNPASSARAQANLAFLRQSEAQHRAEAEARGDAVPSRAAPAVHPAGGGSLNNPDIASGLRQPRLRVLAEGRLVAGAMEASVTSNAHYQADRFSAVFSLGADPAHGAAWWGDQATLLLDIQASLDGGQAWTSLVQGEASQVSIQLLQGEVHVEGRDLTARFIDAKTQETFLNQTSSQVAAALAGRHGMTADVVPTSTTVGRFYTADHDHITASQFSRTTTEWDLLTFLAQQEGYDVWVSGSVLHFRPKAAPDAAPWVVRWAANPAGAPRSNAMDLELDRNLTVARGLVVEVRSWSSRSGRGFTKIARATGKGPSKSRKSPGDFADKPQVIAVQRPNLTEDDAQKLANRILAEESAHERVIRWREPADLALSPRALVRLEGTGSSWDQSYYVASVQRRLSIDGGFVMSIEAKNHSPESQLASP